VVDKEEALKLALEALTYIHSETSTEEDALIDEAIIAIKEALAQPAQEPVAWRGYDLDGMVEAFSRVIEAHHNNTNPFHSQINADAMVALRILRGFIPYMKRHTTPPQRPWVGLTEDEIKKVIAEVSQIPPIDFTSTTYGRAIEAKLKEKNT